MGRCPPRAMIVKGKLYVPWAMMMVISALFWADKNSALSKNNHGPVLKPFGEHREFASEVGVLCGVVGCSQFAPSSRAGPVTRRLRAA
eukprot:3633184-Lingulodinium_polyedra.AAC.1